MTEQQGHSSLIRANQIQQIPEKAFSHPLNPNSEIHGVSLSEHTGLRRLGFHLVRIPPHKESFIVISRYPGPTGEISEQEYQQAILIAQRVLTWAESIIAVQS